MLSFIKLIASKGIDVKDLTARIREPIKFILPGDGSGPKNNLTIGVRCAYICFDPRGSLTPSPERAKGVENPPRPCGSRIPGAAVLRENG